jgi:putative endonuclease
MFYVYVIKNSQNGKIYIGQTSNLEKRLKRHNGQLSNKRKSFTYKNKGSGEWILVYKEEFEERKDALKREKELKSFQGRKFLRDKILGP